MNIGIVCYPTFGGSGVVATELGITLANRGHNIHFITYARPVRLPSFSENIYFHEVSVEDYPLFAFVPYESALSSRIVDVARFQKLDLLHVHYAIPHASSAIMARNILKEFGKYLPVITTLHGTDITLVGKDKSYEPVVAYSINQSDGVTAVSNYLKEITNESFTIRKDIRVIPNFVNRARFHKLDKSHFKQIIAPNGEKILIHISNFRAVKRVEDCILMFDLLRKKMPCKLLMVGDGPERAHAEELCRKLNTCDDVRFLGKQNSIEEVMAISDLFLMPSAYESFGLAALEAMACGLPVISSNTGGLSEVNIDGYSGFLSDVGNVEHMAEKAFYILSDQKVYSTFSANAFKQAEKFDVEKIITQYESYYQEVVNFHQELV
jgi:N-acetyl-alpha-D-glucosaminyl L-malate synthase BshA